VKLVIHGVVYMCKRKYIAVMIVFFSCISSAFGMNKIEENYIVTINGVEMYNNAAIVLLRQIADDEKEIVSIYDRKTEERLEVAENILKPGINILIDDSKEMAIVSMLVEKLRIRYHDYLDSCGIIKDEDISVMRIGDKFSLADSSDIGDRIILFINDMFQVTKMYIFRGGPSEVQSAIPIPELEYEHTT